MRREVKLSFFLYEHRKNASIKAKKYFIGDDMEIFEIKNELEEMNKTLDDLRGSL